MKPKNDLVYYWGEGFHWGEGFYFYHGIAAAMGKAIHSYFVKTAVTTVTAVIGTSSVVLRTAVVAVVVMGTTHCVTGGKLWGDFCPFAAIYSTESISSLYSICNEIRVESRCICYN